MSRSPFLRRSACAIAAFAVMLGLLAACSTTGAGVAADAGAGDARPRGGGECCTPGTSECGPREDDGGCNRCCQGDACGLPPDPDGTCRGPGPGGCRGAAPTKADLDQSGGWKPPPAAQTVCSASDITAFEASLKGAPSYSDLIKGLPAACGACILGKEGGATWPFIVVDDTDPKLGFLNYGACYARAGGGSDACGKAVQYSKFCINAACSDCVSPAEKTACQSDTATQQACSASFAADIQAGCGADQAKLKALDDACGTATLAVGVLCGGGGTGDGG
jgi:hypothetical protein